MAQADKRKKKPQEAAQSTDRAGFLLLPLGLAVLALGFMLTMGVLLQTSSYALYFFKSAATGTGGMLTYAVPVFMLWLGMLLCAASKRRVSLSVFSESLLLLLAVAAMMNLTLRVFDTPLMQYVGLNAQSLMDYLRAPFLLDAGVLSLSGGAMGMLLAYPLYTALGAVGGAIADALVILSLVFSLLRVSPARMLRSLAGRNAAVPAQPQTEPAAPAPQPDAAEIPGPAIETPPTPVAASAPATAAAPPPARKPRRAEAPLPGFVPQPAVTAPQTAFVTSAPSVALPPEPAPAPAWPGVATAVLEAEPAPVRVSRRAASRQPAQNPAPVPVIQPQPVTDVPKAAPKPEPVTDIPKTAPKPEPRAEIPAAPAQPQPAPAQSHSQPIPASTRPQPAPAPAPVKAVKASDGLLFTPGLDGVAKTAVKPVFTPAPDDYEMPPVHLLTEPPPKPMNETTQEDEERARRLIETLNSFSIDATLQEIIHGPAVTRFAIRLAEGVYVNRLLSVMDNLHIELKARGKIRAEIPIPGTSFVGLEVSNDKPSTVYLREVLTSPEMTSNPSPTCVALGRDITGIPITCELMDMPHLLIAGATGSGKSVCLNSIICSLLYRATPRQVRLIMVDPKFVELHPYNEVPHLLMPVVSDVKKASLALEWVCRMMDERYKVMVSAGVRNLDAYNAKLKEGEEPLPRVVVIVDEMADLMTTNASRALIEDHIKRITAKARAAGISLVMATQRPSVNVVTGVIKANIPARIAFKVSSSFDSKTILDMLGAERLLGHGDMLLRSSAREPQRVQGCYVADRDVEQTLAFIRERHPADYDPDLLEYTEKPEQAERETPGDASDDGGDFDEKLQEAIEMAVESGQMSISMLQRVLRVGYARAGRLIDEMARRGVISGNEGTKARKTLMTREQYYNEIEKSGGTT